MYTSSELEVSIKLCMSLWKQTSYVYTEEGKESTLGWGLFRAIFFTATNCDLARKLVCSHREPRETDTKSQIEIAPAK
jgi:hypothetical protein